VIGFGALSVMVRMAETGWRADERKAQVTVADQLVPGRTVTYCDSINRCVGHGLGGQ
jgi:hypothetical protein